jgi:hypothetical protein
MIVSDQSALRFKSDPTLLGRRNEPVQSAGGQG